MDIRTTFHNLSDTEFVHDHLHASLSTASFADSLVLAEAVISRHPNGNEVTCQLCLVMSTGDFIDCSSAARDAQQAIKVSVKRAAKLNSKTKSKLGSGRASAIFGSKKPLDQSMADTSADGT